MPGPIYLDNNSTTPLDPRVEARMLPFFRRAFGNPASRDHAFGWDAQEAVEEARSEVAALLGADAREIVFTSCATESIHLALKGLFPWGMRIDSNRGGLLVSAVEHDAVLGAARQLSSRGIPLATLPVDAAGRLDLSILESALDTARPKVLALMAANNETGVRFPIREAAALAHARDALLFTDATQALGKVPLNAREDGFDLAAFSAHKLNGPKGVGALFLRGGPGVIPLDPQLAGGGHESGLRAGSLNVPGIVGFGEACRLAREEMEEDAARMRGLRDRLEAGLTSRFPEIRIVGDPESRLPNTSNLLFPGTEARALIRDLHDVAVATRSACSTGSSEASHVLKAMGLSYEDSHSCIRFSLGRFTTAEEIESTLEKMAASYPKLRRGGPL